MEHCNPKNAKIFSQEVCEADFLSEFKPKASSVSTPPTNIIIIILWVKIFIWGILAYAF